MSVRDASGFLEKIWGEHALRNRRLSFLCAAQPSRVSRSTVSRPIRPYGFVRGATWAKSAMGEVSVPCCSSELKAIQFHFV